MEFVEKKQIAPSWCCFFFSRAIHTNEWTNEANAGHDEVAAAGPVRYDHIWSRSTLSVEARKSVLCAYMCGVCVFLLCLYVHTLSVLFFLLCCYDGKKVVGFPIFCFVFIPLPGKERRMHATVDRLRARGQKRFSFLKKKNGLFSSLSLSLSLLDRHRQGNEKGNRVYNEITAENLTALHRPRCVVQLKGFCVLAFMAPCQFWTRL